MGTLMLSTKRDSDVIHKEGWEEMTWNKPVYMSLKASPLLINSEILEESLK